MQANCFGQKRQQTRTANLLFEPSLWIDMICSDLVSLLLLAKKQDIDALLIKLQRDNFIVADCNMHPRIEYCRRKGSHWIVEQPSSSLLPFYKPFEVGLFQLAVTSMPEKLSCYVCNWGVPHRSFFEDTRQKHIFWIWVWWVPPHRDMNALLFLHAYLNVLPPKPCDLRKKTMLISNAPWLDGLKCESMTAERRMGCSVSYTQSLLRNL